MGTKAKKPKAMRARVPNYYRYARMKQVINCMIFILCESK